MIYLLSKDGSKYTGSPDITSPLEKLVNGVKVPQKIILQKNKKKQKTQILDGNMNPVEIEADLYAYKGTFSVQGLEQYREGTFLFLPDVKNVNMALNPDDWETVEDETLKKETPKTKEETPEEIEEREFQEFKAWKAKNKA